MKTNNLQMDDLVSLRKETLEYNERWAKSGKPLRLYECPCCFKTNQTVMPTTNLVDGRGYWDSATTCYHCGELYYIVKYPTDHINPNIAGSIHVKTLD